MDIALMKESHENFFLKEGYLLALQFAQGWACFRILGWEPSNVKPYSLGVNLLAGTNLAAWNEIVDAGTRRYLMPPEERWIYHSFWGVNKPKARIYFQYPTRQDRWNLVAVQRTIVGDVGYIDGEMSPFDGPFALKSQIFAINQLYPAFQCYNPLPDAMDNVMLNFDVMRYSYALIKDKSIIKDILTLRRPGSLHTMGGVDPEPARIPDWLSEDLGNDLLAYSKSVTEEGG
ncbi:MAG TPA: hypothetical protein VMV84_02925 [Dehalococcoidales bacterium]|nr:hypothetical protein [Dehalococcoidales bacterium]